VYTISIRRAFDPLPINRQAAPPSYDLLQFSYFPPGYSTLYPIDEQKRSTETQQPATLTLDIDKDEETVS